MNWSVERAEVIHDPAGARAKAVQELQRLAQLDDPEGFVVPILVHAILVAEAYRSTKHAISALPELTEKVDQLFRALNDTPAGAT